MEVVRSMTGNRLFRRNKLMKKLFCIGEALIDFIPKDVGKPMKAVSAFEPKVGGAPLNVAAVYSRLGGPSSMITQLGDDPFGDKIVDELNSVGVDMSLVKRTAKANTSLAFVALKEDGNREFSFYRKPGADMLYAPGDIEPEWFEDTFALHFCSVSLGDFPMKEAHRTAIRAASEKGALISFDPNLRFNLWADTNELKAAVDEFIPEADILKVSDEEIEFITGEKDIDAALPKLFQGRVKLVVYTAGPDGAYAYTKTVSAFAPGQKVKALDTTGAGDAFIGSFLYQLSEKGITSENIAELDESALKDMLSRSNAYCADSVQKPGAIASYADTLSF